jgi:hypothetical protein
MAVIEGGQESPGENALGSLTIEELLERFGVPGVSVAVIKDFEIHWAKGYGIADVETGAPVDTETMFQAASITRTASSPSTTTSTTSSSRGRWTEQDSRTKDP